MNLRSPNVNYLMLLQILCFSPLNLLRNYIRHLL